MFKIFLFFPFLSFRSFTPQLLLKAPSMRQIAQSSRAALATLFVLATLIHFCSATAICYYPNGDIASTYRPCNDTADGSPSACCELSSSACSLTGYCYGNAGVMYRGGCTDSTFNAVECPQKCKDVNTGAFSNINLCPGSDGNGFFTCSGSGEFTIDMCQTNFTFNAGTPFTPSSAAASQGTTTITTTATLSASSPNSNTALSSSTAQASCSDPTVTVGLAVGIPLGLLAAFLAAVIFWQHRKHTSTTRQPTLSGMLGPSPPSQGYPASHYTAATSGTIYGTEATMSPQQYPKYYPHHHHQQEWKTQPEARPAELQSVDRRHELQER